MFALSGALTLSSVLWEESDVCLPMATTLWSAYCQTSGCGVLEVVDSSGVSCHSYVEAEVESEVVMGEGPPCTEPAHQYFLTHLPNSAVLPTRLDPEQPSYHSQGLLTIPRAGATEMRASKSTVPPLPE